MTDTTITLTQRRRLLQLPSLQLYRLALSPSFLAYFD